MLYVKAEWLLLIDFVELGALPHVSFICSIYGWQQTQSIIM